MGNQLFQIAATISLALSNNDKYIFPNWEYKKDFNLPENCFHDHISPTHTYHEPHFHYSKIPYNIGLNDILDIVGYWQSFKYFDNNQDIIHGLLTPKNCPSIQWGTTAIHIRRGDYVNLPNHYSQLDIHYYNRAMNMIKSNKYVIFSDDIKWCKDMFKGEQFIFSGNNQPIDDLRWMSKCENIIMANSSFSWWGAFLNKNPSKIVICPKNWFGPQLPHDTKDLIPESWKRI